MEDLKKFLERNKKGDLDINEIRIELQGLSSSGSDDDEANIYGMEIRINENESFVNILNCQFETYNADSSNLDNGSYNIANIVNELERFSGTIMCKYYNGYSSSEGEKIGMLSFEYGQLKFFRDATDENTNGWVVVTGGTGVLYKYEGVM